MATVTITGSTRDITGRADNRPWKVWAVTYEDGEPGVITTRHSPPIYPLSGVLTLEVEADVEACIETPDGDRHFITTPLVDADLWDVLDGDGS